MTTATTTLVLTAARRIVGRAIAAARTRPPDLSVAAIAALLEEDDTARAGLDAAAGERLRSEVADDATFAEGAAAARRRRADEVHYAVDRLVLQGELALDGPGRMALPGFGPSTWRAIAVLRERPGGEAERLAAAVAAPPLGDLGDAAPPELRELGPDPALARAARAILALDAERQDLRNALFTVESHLATAIERGNSVGARRVAADLVAVRDALDAADRAAAERWEAGLRAAAVAARA